MGAGATVVELVAVATTRWASAHRKDVDVRLSARLSDGREMLLLDDRGFSSFVDGAEAISPGPDDDELLPCAWCVGPDERHDDRTDEDMAHAHFGSLAATLAAADVHATIQTLMSVPFRVIWGDRERLWPGDFDWY